MQTKIEPNLTFVEISELGQKTRISIFEDELPFPLRREETLDSDGNVKTVKEMAANQIVVAMLNAEIHNLAALCVTLEQKCLSKGLRVSFIILKPYKDTALYYLKFSAAPELFTEIFNEVSRLIKDAAIIPRCRRHLGSVEMTEKHSHQIVSPIMIGLVESEMSQDRKKTIITLFKNPEYNQIIRKEEITFKNGNVIHNQNEVTDNASLNAYHNSFFKKSAVKKVKITIDNDSGFPHPVRTEEFFDEKSCVKTGEMCADHILFSRNSSFSLDVLKMRLQSQGADFSLSEQECTRSMSFLFFKPYQTELSMPIVIKEMRHLDNQSYPEQDFMRQGC